MHKLFFIFIPKDFLKMCNSCESLISHAALDKPLTDGESTIYLVLVVLYVFFLFHIFKKVRLGFIKRQV